MKAASDAAVAVCAPDTVIEPVGSTRKITGLFQALYASTIIAPVPSARPRINSLPASKNASSASVRLSVPAPPPSPIVVPRRALAHVDVGERW